MYKSQKDIFFISLVRTGTKKRFIDGLNKSKMRPIYKKRISKNNHTETYGKLMNGKIYGKNCRILVCYNPDIEAQKNKTLDKRVEGVRKKVTDINKLEKPDVSEAKALITKYHLKRALKVTGRKKFKLVVNDTELKERRKYFGFFVLFSNDLNRGYEMIDIYKSRNIVEEGFRALKSEMEITPEYHSRDDRIETHNVLVICGYLLLSVLRAVLADHKKEYSFGTLKRLLTSGYLNEGYYEHEQFKEKKLWLRQPKGFKEELKTIFSSLKIKIPKFEVDLVPTNSREE
jgi:transposase